MVCITLVVSSRTGITGLKEISCLLMVTRMAMPLFRYMRRFNCHFTLPSLGCNWWIQCGFYCNSWKDYCKLSSVCRMIFFENRACILDVVISAWRKVWIAGTVSHTTVNRISHGKLSPRCTWVFWFAKVKNESLFFFAIVCWCHTDIVSGILGTNTPLQL